MKLLIDFGNTRLKWATLDRQRVQAGGVFAHADCALIAELRREWSELTHVDAVLVASVVAPTLEAALAALVHERFGLHAEFLRSPAAALGLRNAYAAPARLGIDRFLTMAAAHAERPCARVVVSVGTALTLDALDAEGVHHGGIIVASPRLMRDALLTGTARVGSTEGHYDEMPTNTADAVASGALDAAAGAVARFRATAMRRFGTLPAVVLTGGGADELAPLLGDVERAHDLVLRGLALWAQALPQDG